MYNSKDNGLLLMSFPGILIKCTSQNVLNLLETLVKYLNI